MDTTELKQRASAIIAVNRQGSTDAPDPDAVDSMLADAVSLAESALALLRGFENGAITHFPFIGKNGQVGLRNVHSDGRVEFLYLNPSAYDEEGGPSATEGCSVFLYQGTEGEPEDDTPQHFYYIFNPADWEDPMASTRRKPVTLHLGPVQANVVIDALTAYGCDIGAEVASGESYAVRASQILQNVRDDIARQLRRAGREANW